MVRSIFIFLYYITQAYEYIFIVYVLLNFFSISKSHFLIRAIDSICAPVYYAFLRFLPRLSIGIFDFSPLYVIIFLYVLKSIFLRLSMLFL